MKKEPASRVEFLRAKIPVSIFSYTAGGRTAFFAGVNLCVWSGNKRTEKEAIEGIEREIGRINRGRK